MKRTLFAAMILALVCAPFWIGGCGDDKNSTTPEETGLTDEEVATTQEITGAFGSILQIVVSVQTAIQDALPDMPTSVAAGDLARTTCPTVRIDGIGIGHLEATIDYGSGCTTESGSTASGAMHASYSSASGTETIDVVFDAFTIDGSTIQGTLTATGSGTTWSFAFDGTLDDTSQTIGLVAAIGLVVDLAGTPTDPADDTYTITGGGSYTQDEKTYLLAIMNPLVLTSACDYPTTGILTYQIESDRPTAVTSIDFGAGDCCTALVSVGSRSEEMSLCEQP